MNKLKLFCTAGIQAISRRDSPYLASVHIENHTADFGDRHFVSDDERGRRGSKDPVVHKKKLPNAWSGKGVGPSRTDERLSGSTDLGDFRIRTVFEAEGTIALAGSLFGCVSSVLGIGNLELEPLSHTHGAEETRARSGQNSDSVRAVSRYFSIFATTSACSAATFFSSPMSWDRL